MILNMHGIRTAANITIAGCLLVIVATDYFAPWTMVVLHGAKYKELVYECELAMIDEVSIRTKKHTNAALVSAQVGLLVCHEYDKLRKRLLIAGVSESRLALFGLEALEKEAVPVSRMISPHQMDRF